MSEKAVRIYRFQVLRPDGGDTDYKVWHKLTEECQQIANGVWRQWLVHHEKAGTAKLIREYLAKPKETRGKPEHIKCIPPGAFYKPSAAAHPNVNVLTVNTITNTTCKKIGKLKSIRGSLPGWWSVLLDQQGYPSMTNRVPIPFIPKQCRIREPEDAKDDWKVELDIGRVPPTEGKKQGKSQTFIVPIKTKHKGAGNANAILRNVISGHWKFCGSNLVYDRNLNKWFLMLAYQQPKETLELDANKTAYVRAESDRPLTLDVPDGKGRYSKWIMDRGQSVGAVRRQLQMQRKARQANYRHAAKSTKGHGRRRATQAWEGKIHQRWLSFVKNFNRQAARQIVDECIRRKIGAIQYEQPTFNKGLFLPMAGVVEERSCAGWSWYELGQAIEQAASKVGIKVNVEKISRPEQGEDIDESKGV